MNILSPLGWLYAGAMELRNALYDRGVFASESLGARTISIGNISVGGTGKTPVVALVARLLADNGERVCILTRGYGRKNPSRQIVVSDRERVLVDARTGGDEPVELALKLVGKSAVIADRDRVGAARIALEKLGTTAFVLDDAFQHRRVARDLDIICIDATNPFRNDEVLPAGTLRERPANLSRADAIVITRANLVEDVLDLRSQISNYAPEAAIFEAVNRITTLIELEAFFENPNDNQRLSAKGDPKSEIQDRSAFAFCGLCNPSSFFRQLRRDEFDLKGQKAFPDHYYYKPNDIKNIEKRAGAAGAELLITTGKDAARLFELEFAMPCYVAETDLVIDQADAFRTLIIS